MYFVIEKLGVKHIVLVLLLIIYTFFGAYLMIVLESPSDKNLKRKVYESKMAEFNEFQRYQSKLEAMINVPKRIPSSDRVETMKWCIAKSTISKPQPEETVWNIWEAIFYVTSLYTTVGYGNVYPITIGGRCFTMIYAIMGIPLVILILDDWGNLLFRLVCLVWNKVARRKTDSNNCCASCCRKTEIENLAEGQDVINMRNVPLLLALFICIGYICFCAAIYLIWEEDWTYFMSFYFFFISLTTVGLGDVMPNHIEYSVCASVLVLFGLAVVSMCLNVIQAKLDAAFKDLTKVIDRKYKQSLQNYDENNKEEGVKDGMKDIEKEQNWQKRLMYKMMNDQKKQLLEEKVNQKAKLRNKGVQAVSVTSEFSSQTAMGTEEITTQTNEETSSDSDSFLPIYRWDMMDIV